MEMIGHNQAPLFERLVLRAQELTAEAENAPPVVSQEMADKYGGYLKAVSDVIKQAEAERIAEKRPHLTAVRIIEERWQGQVLGPVRKVFSLLKKRLVEWEIAQAAERKRIADEAKAKAEEARREADEAERRIKEAQEQARAGGPFAPRAYAEAVETMRAAEAAEKAAKVAANAKSTTGAQYATASGQARAVSLVTTRSAVIKDRRACALFYLSDEKMGQVLQTLADRDVRQGLDVPGCEVIETKDVRL